MRFLNREKELKKLNGIYAKKEAQFVALYGRRRIGKTFLLSYWLSHSVKKDYILWTARRTTKNLLLKSFSQSVLPYIDTVDIDFCFSSWENALKQIAELSKNRKFVLVIDEFPYLCESVPEISTILQMVWDHHLKNTNLMLLVSGSNFNMMHGSFIKNTGALYGRTTGDIFIHEIEPEKIHLFLPSYSFEQIIETYSIIGGVPKYLEMWDTNVPVMKNIENLILSPVTIFRQEPAFLIHDEIAEPRTYYAVLEAIGFTKATPKQISEFSGIALSHIGKYLDTLLLLKLIRRIVSVDTQDKRNTRKSCYEICDPFLKFYFTYLAPNTTLIEQNRQKRLLRIIYETFQTYVAKCGFEELCRRFIIHLGDDGQFPFFFDYIGRIWNRFCEIDLAAINKKTRSILLGECKWTNKKVNISVLNELKAKKERLPSLKGYKVLYAFFSKSGFTADLKKKAENEHVYLYDKHNMVLY